MVPVFPGHFLFMPLKLNVSGISMPVSPLPTASFNQQKPCHLVPSQPHAVPAIACHLGFSKQGSTPSRVPGLLTTLISHLSLPSQVSHCWLGLVFPTLTLIWGGYQGLLVSSQEGSEGHPRSMFLNLHLQWYLCITLISLPPHPLLLFRPSSLLTKHQDTHFHFKVFLKETTL